MRFSPNRNDYFFVCDNDNCAFFAFLRDTYGDSFIPAEDRKKCACRMHANIREVAKAGKNQGRSFYTCGRKSRNLQCKFFKFID